MSDLSDLILRASGIKTNIQFKIACIYGNHGLPMIGDLDVHQSADPLELADAIETEVPRYNDFKGADVASAIRALHEKGLIMKVSFGREGSPVLYLQPPFWTGQASNKISTWQHDRKFCETERKSMFDQILSILRDTTKPDELDVSIADYEIRAWWD